MDAEGHEREPCAEVSSGAENILLFRNNRYLSYEEVKSNVMSVALHLSYTLDPHKHLTQLPPYHSSKMNSFPVMTHANRHLREIH